VRDGYGRTFCSGLPHSVEYGGRQQNQAWSSGSWGPPKQRGWGPAQHTQRAEQVI